MQHEQQPAILASPPTGEDAARLASQSLVLAYHERSKHRLERYAAGPEALDWDAQPNPFREFAAAPRIKLPLVADQLGASFADLHLPNVHGETASPDDKTRHVRFPHLNPDGTTSHSTKLPEDGSQVAGYLPEGEETNERLREFQVNAIAPQPLTLESIAALLELAFGLSAWKEYGPDRWAVRCNPSSGNLHPTEAYVIARQISGLEDGVYHYLSRDHLLEQRCKFAATGQPGLLVGLSSIFWREAWKYGERAFRYCQLDTGHAIGALRYAAAALGWTLHVNNCNHQQLARWLGLDRDADFTGAEREEAELLMEITIGMTAMSSDNLKFAHEHWYGQANTLDAHPMYRWPIIDEVTLASRKPSIPLKTDRPAENYPPLKRDAEIQNHDIRAATLIRQRRSAQRFNAKCIQEAGSFYHMLDALLPRPAVPWDVWPEQSRVHPVLFVHRVAGLTPGIYALPRSPAAQRQMKSSMRSDFLWAKPADCPEHLPFFLLAEADLSKTAKIMNCHQAIAGDSTFALAMLAEFDAPLKDAPWRYRELYWEAGLLGQVLYLQAEAAGLRGTGIGCFFDDTLHDLLGLQDRTFQSLYHFTVGYPLTDERIASLPPYPSIPTNS